MKEPSLGKKLHQEKQLLDILVKWNARELTHKEAVWKIYNLYRKEVLVAWRIEMKSRELRRKFIVPDDYKPKVTVTSNCQQE